MSMNISVPDDLYQKAAEIARAQNITVEELFASVFEGQLAEWERLQIRAARGRRDKFLAVLDSAPDVDPIESDRSAKTN